METGLLLAASIPGNLLQIGLAAVITLAIVGRLNTAAKRIGLKEA